MPSKPPKPRRTLLQKLIRARLYGEAPLHFPENPSKKQIVTMAKRNMKAYKSEFRSSQLKDIKRGREGRYTNLARDTRLKTWREISSAREAPYREYAAEAERLKPRIPSALLESQKRGIAQDKLAQIRTIAVPYERVDQVVSGIPQRFESISAALDMLRRPRIHQEAMLFYGPFGMDTSESSGSRSNYLAGEADMLTDWCNRNYSCRLFFGPDVFRFLPGYSGWGEINAKPEDILGIQIFDSDPKKLLEVAKVVAKRIPNNPIVIIDLYGNVFYP